MKQLTKEGALKLEEIAIRHGLAKHSVETMLQAVLNGNGSMAQFTIPELGGQGQWMKGGMTMVGDMFNYSLKSSVNDLCTELSLLIDTPGMTEERKETAGVFSGAAAWWPSEFGRPQASGAQNNFRYAYFGAPTHRLILEAGGNQTIYDTTGYQIGGVSQQQGAVNRYSFTSQKGTVDLSTLPVVVPEHLRKEKTTGTSAAEETEPVSEDPFASDTAAFREEDVFTTIEKLAQLKQKGYITDDEYNSKKTELLKRL